jgi:16S rRNA (uracil1498-N3)-methyltransferase
MQLFYGTQLDDGILTLSEQESLHCARVLRMNAGNPIQVTDGKGNMYQGIIQQAHDKKTTVEVLETTHVPLPAYTFHLYVALTKHSDRLEWMLEKCTEMGITSFTPLLTQRTERKNIRIDRLESIVLSAMKQSLKAWLPTVNPPLPFQHLLSNPIQGTPLIAHCINEMDKTPLTQINLCGTTHIFIGPEGDFTPDEMKAAIAAGFTSISLGPHRLRTETAGLLACSAVYLANFTA